jgi:hypothetical protein
MADGSEGVRVVDSFENPERDRCVDIFVRQDGSFGFEEWRREPEEPGRWFRARYHAHAVFASPADAVVAARASVPWFGDLARGPGT